MLLKPQFSLELIRFTLLEFFPYNSSTFPYHQTQDIFDGVQVRTARRTRIPSCSIQYEIILAV
jgi:hypothetical protein